MKCLERWQQSEVHHLRLAFLIANDRNKNSILLLQHRADFVNTTIENVYFNVRYAKSTNAICTKMQQQ